MKHIRLDATIKSHLKWDIEPSDEKIIWHLDLGLESLTKPLSDVHQCSTLKFAVDHFVKTVYSNFPIEKCIIYQGPLPQNDFETRNQLSDYLDIITANVPKSFVMELDFVEDSSLHPIFNAHLFNCEAFPRFTLVKKVQKESNIGILLPPREVTDLSALISKADKQSSYKVLSETELLYEFGGLDQIIYNPLFISHDAQRVLNGFIATDGLITPC